MTKDWKKIAQANGLGIPSEEVDRMAPPLDALEAAFRPLVQSIGREIDPAIVFQAAATEGAE